MFDFFRRLFDTTGFHEEGRGWSPELMQIHLLCDAATATAFLVVFAVLAIKLFKNRHANFPKKVWFPVLLLAIAGLLHCMAVWQFYWPAYRFSALLKMVSAIVSWMTMLSFVPFVSRWISGETWNDLEVQIKRRREAEKRFHDSEAVRGSLLENMPFHFFRKDLTGHFVEMNDRFCEQICIPREQLLGKTDYDIFPEAEAKKYRDDDLRVMKSGEPVEDVEEQTLPDGQITFVQVLKATVRDAAGKVVGVQGIFWDVTARRQAENARKLSDARFRQLVDSSLIGVIVADDKGGLLDVNQAFLNMLGYSWEEFHSGNLRWDKLTPDEYRPLDERALDLMAKQGSCPPWEKEYFHKSGYRVPVLLGVTPLLQETHHFICFVLDITERKRFERELQEAKDAADAANEAKSVFLANMSHEVRTPMNAIIGLTDLVVRSNIAPQQGDYLKMVLESAEGLLLIINDILDFSKIEAGKMNLHPEPFWLRDCIVDSIRPFSLRAHEKGINLGYDVAANVPNTVSGDAGRLRQIIVNLVGNALKFTESGSVVVSVEAEDATLENLALHFTVTDTGIGIPAGKCDSIFLPFEQADASTTRQHGGTGLGLAIAARFVTLMGGRIWVESEVGKGSLFHFKVPVQRANELVPSQNQVLSVPQGARILVVDDFEVNRRIVLAMLKSWSLRGVSAINANDAMQRIHAAQEEGDAYRLILSDVTMPGDDGFKLVERIIAANFSNRPKVIMLTSGERPDEITRCRELGIEAHLLKPIKQSDLFDAISEVLGEHTLPANSDEPLPSLPSLDILLVEDSLINQKLALGVLHRSEQRVTVANNGKEAVEKTAQHDFDLVLMDIQMPIMDGLDATRLIRQRERITGKHVPIVAMTAHALAGDRERCLATGMDDYLSKPIRPHELLEKIATVTGKALFATALPVKPEQQTKTAFDIAHALDSTAGDTVLLCELIDAYFLERPRLLRELGESLATNHYEVLHRSAHTLKSALRLFGAKQVEDVAYQIEKLSKAKDLSGVAELHSQLLAQLENLETELRAYQASQQRTKPN